MDNENLTNPITPEISADRQQNLKAIQHISATRSGSVDTVLDVLRECEKIILTAEQMDVGADIVNSINEHRVDLGVAAWYLIRYGMLLERGGPGRA